MIVEQKIKRGKDVQKTHTSKFARVTDVRII
mgnify:CR=1 FL=1